MWNGTLKTIKWICGCGFPTVTFMYLTNLTHLTRGRSKSHARVYIAAGFGISVVQYKPAEASRE